MRDIDKEVRDMFDGLSREELIEDLRLSGFDVEDGDGQVIFTDENEKVNEENNEIVLKHSRTDDDGSTFLFSSGKGLELTVSDEVYTNYQAPYSNQTLGSTDQKALAA